ncbi:MAG: F0F1 ATP synthase subunit A [Hyphomicrobiaceae bacterium]
MDTNPLHADVLFHIGPVPIAPAVVTTWAIMAGMVFVGWLGMRRQAVEGNGLQTILEVVVEAITDQLHQIVGKPNAPFIPMLASLFLFLVCANLSAAVPGAKAPTAQLETPAALAFIVFLSTHYYGVRARGWWNYLRHYTQPSVLLTPLNVLAELTRTLSLMVRLFGNMMSHELVLTIIAVLAGLLVPIPFLLLGILIGLIQAYIFTVLASVYVGAAAGSIAVE